MKRFVAFILLLTAIGITNTASATVCHNKPCWTLYQSNMPNPGPALILFYHNKCEPCKAVLREADAYSRTETGKKVPLRVIHIAAPLPKWLIDAFNDGRIKREKTFPIFIIWDGEKEVERMMSLPTGK